MAENYPLNLDLSPQELTPEDYLESQKVTMKIKSFGKINLNLRVLDELFKWPFIKLSF
ncbi:MAG: hypothetical protein Ct9H90mP10_09600 [Actinomycetota bacterium]|nr:MAG: hypothetical protein Ct9H90mP10_09600 [Actinomycetota bacterium]